ncbi:hypothetical protein IJM86_00950 [bacterium]|nr:hypothetical protein [bacterium]
MYACQTAQEELQNYSSFEGDSSLADAVNEFLEVENTMLDLYNEYFSLEEDLDEESEEEFWETIDDLDTASSTLFEQLATVQEQFAEKYDFSLEDEEE